MKPLAPLPRPLPPRRLALAAPAGVFDEARLEQCLAVLGELAPRLALRRDPEILARKGYLAGGDDLRAGHLERLFADPEVEMVLAVRGGFGCSRLLPRLDLERLAASRTLLMGFSDLTALLDPLAAKGLITLHGPTLSQLPRLDEPSRRQVRDLLDGRPPWPAVLEGRPLAGGMVRGPLLGGNLTLLTHLVGTPYLPDLDGAVLFLEDTGEAPYRLDRMLTQLELAGVLPQVAGVALGGFGPQGETTDEVLEALWRRLEPLGVPVVAGLPFGHGSANRILPLGALAELDGDRGRLTVGVELG